MQSGNEGLQPKEVECLVVCVGVRELLFSRLFDTRWEIAWYRVILLARRDVDSGKAPVRSNTVCEWAKYGRWNRDGRRINGLIGLLPGTGCRLSDWPMRESARAG